MSRSAAISASGTRLRVRARADAFPDGSFASMGATYRSVARDQRRRSRRECRRLSGFRSKRRSPFGRDQLGSSRAATRPTHGPIERAARRRQDRGRGARPLFAFEVSALARQGARSSSRIMRSATASRGRLTPCEWSGRARRARRCRSRPSRRAGRRAGSRRCGVACARAGVVGAREGPRGGVRRTCWARPWCARARGARALREVLADVFRRHDISSWGKAAWTLS